MTPRCEAGAASAGARNAKAVSGNLGILGPPFPVRDLHQIHFLPGSVVDFVAVDPGFFDRPGQVKTADGVVLAQVVADCGPDVAGVDVALVPPVIADQHESALVVMSVIMLEGGVPRVIVRVEPLAVSRTSCQVGLVVLENRIVATPRPDPGIEALRPLVAALCDIEFDPQAVARPRNNAVPSNVLHRVVPDGDTQARKPELSHPVGRLSRNSGAVDLVHGAVIDREPVGRKYFAAVHTPVTVAREDLFTLQ